jgi:hypothetical protein
MPRQSWQCNKCNHPFGNQQMAENCEKSHISLLTKKNHVVECYYEMDELPNAIEITTKTGETLQFLRTANKKVG